MARAFSGRLHRARTAIVHRARRHGTAGVKTLAIGGVVGAAGQIAGNFVAKQSVTIRNTWWGMPAAMGVGAYLLAKRYPAWSMALAGAAGYAAKVNYDLTAGGKTPIPTTDAYEENTGAADDAISF